MFQNAHILAEIPVELRSKAQKLMEKKVEPISADLMKKVFEQSLTVRERKDIEEKIWNRFSYTAAIASFILGSEIHSIYYDTENSEFDEIKYEHNISFEVSYSKVYSLDLDGFYESSIPTAWLSENFEEKLILEVKKHRERLQKNKAKEEKKANLKKEKEEGLIASIKSKLTPEELKLVTIKRKKK